MSSINDNTNNLDLYEKVNFLFKNYLGFPNTDKNKAFFYETTVKANNYLFGGEIFLDTIPLTPDFNNGQTNTPDSLNIDPNKLDSSVDSSIHTDSTGVIRRFTKIKLEKISGTERGYYCLDQSGNNILKDALQFNLNNYTDGNKIIQPYLYKLFSKNQVDNSYKNITPTSSGGNWIFDVKNGVVNFPDEINKKHTVDENNPPYLTFYKYVGRKGIDKINIDDINQLNEQTNDINQKINDNSGNINTIKTQVDNLSLNDLKFVNTAGLSTGDVLKWDGVKWGAYTDLQGDGSGSGGGGGGSSRNIYSQILDISSNSLNSEVRSITNLSENTLTNNVYEVNNDAKQLIIDYRFFISFIEGSTEITSNISGIEIGVDALFEIYLKVHGNILENTRQFVHLNIHEKYVTFKTVLNISDELIIKNIITSQKSLPFEICVKSHSARSFKLHQTQNNSQRPDNLKITSIGTQGDENNSENNIKHYFANNNVKNSLQINDSTSYQITEQILTDHSINSNITELDIHYRPYVHFDSSTSDNGFNLTDVIIKYNIEISIDGGPYESIGEEFKRIQYFDNYVDFFIKKKYSELQSIIILSVRVTLTSVLNSNINIHKSDKPSKLEVISYSSFDKNVKTNQVLEYITSNLNGSIVEPNNRSDLNVQNVVEYADIVYSSTSLNNIIILMIFLIVI